MQGALVPAVGWIGRYDGTSGNTISRLDLPEAEKARLLNNIPVAYAVSYPVGTGFVVLLTR